MRKSLLISIIVLLFAISNINAKTIWLKDLTSNEFGEFYNAIWEDLKETRFGPYCKYVTDNKSMNEQQGDLVVEISGMDIGQCGLCAMLIMCVVNSDLSWYYCTSGMHAFSYDNTIEQARKAKKRILEFLNKKF